MKTKEARLDTRAKVMTLAQAAGLAVETLVVGYFDPLLAGNVARLTALGGPVTLSLLDPPDEILPAQARAELAASLACVERVILGDARGIVHARQTVDCTKADLETRQKLIQRIRQS